MDFRLPLSVQTDSLMPLSKHIWSQESNGMNFVYSPFSIYMALGLLTSGSNGRTLEQMLMFLKSNSLDHLHSVGSQLIESVTETEINEGGGGGPKLSFISGVWIENSSILKPLFKEIVNSIYRAEAEAVDFRTKANEVKEKVNKWVENETNGLIKDLLPPGSIDQYTRLVLANALYFKGEWDQDQFDATRTKNSEFHLLNGVGSVQVPFMTSHNYQFVSCFNGFKVLQLPYKQAVTNDGYYSQQSHFSMYIFLPDEQDGLGDLMEKVSSDSGFLDRHLPKRKVKMGEFRIPKFKISFGFEASRVLKELGIVLAFDENEADFSEMVTNPLDGGNMLHVSVVHHKCFVEVDEAGTEAAAATAIAILIGSAFGSRPTTIDFVADHPFMFFIRDNLNGVVLFMGHVLNPLQEMLRFLKSNSLDHLNLVGSQLLESVTGTGINQDGGGPMLSFISGAWIENSCNLKPQFKEIVKSIYAVDFKTKANEVREKVNKWAEKETNGLIKDLLPHGSINQDTRFVLANALYFKGEWNQRFDPTRTRKYEFHLFNGVGSVQVPFMTNYEHQFVSCFNGFKVLQLPYKQAATNNDYSRQSHLSMYLFLPDERDGLRDLIEKVSSDSGFLDRHLPERKVKMGEFRIPKFKISFGFEASRVLKELGIVLAFDENEADFSEMVTNPLDGGNMFHVSVVHHKCLVEVDEAGTEAAAATAIGIRFGSRLGSCPIPVDFVADHPFMFLIRDNLNGVVLFMGHVLNPLQEVGN